MTIFPDLRTTLVQEEPSFIDWAKPSAIMVLVATGPEESILLIQRPKTLRHHPGQIACPGGRFDPDVDQTLWDAAHRETYEEVGIPVPEGAFVGFLDPVHIRVTGFTLLPAVAIVGKRPLVVAQPHEVADYAWVTFRELRRCRRVTSVLLGDATYRLPEYGLKWGRLWGATAQVVDQLLNRWPL